MDVEQKRKEEYSKNAKFKMQNERNSLWFIVDSL